jgi:diadenosine tetraphosphatase ApaH/serine/threonine PP2A family protein phosphatase
MFDFLTLSVVIDDRIFCVHGGESRLFQMEFMRGQRMRADGRAGMIGLSPSIHSIDQIKVIDRFRGWYRLLPRRILAIADNRILFARRDPTRRSDGRSRLVRSGSR